MVTQRDLDQFRSHPGASFLALGRLEELDLSACPRLTDTSITQVGPCCVGAGSGSAYQGSACLGQVVRYPDLRSLSLSALTEITDASLVSVARHCRSLSSLALSHCPGVGDRGVAQAAPHLRRLQHLYLSCCDNVTDG